MAKCRLFKIDDGLKPVVEDGLYMKNYLTENMSVSVVKFISPKGGNIPAKAHQHGEEASLQVTGACNVYVGPGDKDDPEIRLETTDGLIIPADTLHWGSNRFGSEGVSMRLNVVTPPRAEFKSEDDVYYPIKDKTDA